MKKLILLPLLLTLVASSAFSQEPYQWILNMMSKDKKMRNAAAEKLLNLNSPAFAPAMTDMLFFMPRTARPEMIKVLHRITGDNAGETYYDWVEYIGKRSDLKSPPGYIKYKATLLSLIDPSYKKILYTGVPLKIRAEEIVWGGVSRDGIPPIDDPQFIDLAKAELRANEKIFGLSLNGEARAYPLRYLSWHEMLNDRVAGEPITISY